MSDYWLTRHAEALAKAKNAPTDALRKIYQQLAAHYLSLAHSAEARPDEKG